MVIIDEFSMVSQVMLGKIDLRLRQAKINNITFGGLSIILIGDPGQLLPVMGSPLYDKELIIPMAIGGYLAYEKFKKVIVLESVMRQTNIDNDPEQAHFMDLLPRLRNGLSTKEDWELLLTRIPTFNNTSSFINATRIFNDNLSVDNYNIEKLVKCNKPICLIKALNSSVRGELTSSQQFGGLVNSIYLCVDAQVTLINNLWATKGFIF